MKEDADSMVMAGQKEEGEENAGVGTGEDRGPDLEPTPEPVPDPESKLKPAWTSDGT